MARVTVGAAAGLNRSGNGVVVMGWSFRGRGHYTPQGYTAASSTRFTYFLTLKQVPHLSLGAAGDTPREVSRRLEGQEEV